MEVLVSIVVPVYNVENYIERCLRSIATQSYGNYEVIIVDDRGSDNSVKIAKDFVAKENSGRFRILTNPCNKGLSGARNAGLREAKGDYVLFLDSDDYISADCLINLIKPLDTYEYDVVIGAYTEVSYSGECFYGFNTNKYEYKGNVSVLNAYRNGVWYVMAWNKLCKRDFLLQHDLFFKEGLLHEDVLWSFKLFSYAESVYLVKKSTYNYLIREKSIMTSMSVERDIQTYIDVFKEIKTFLKTEKDHISPDAYHLYEGKKSGILYSMLENGLTAVYDKYYPDFHELKLLPFYKIYGLISFSYLIRDFNYALPIGLGRSYKKLFYKIIYKWRGKKISGKLWK